MRTLISWIKYEWNYLRKTDWEIIEEWHNPVYRPNLHNQMNPTAVITWKNKNDNTIREQIIVL
jgi:hypothetical protein